jgi:acetate kinase
MGKSMSFTPTAGVPMSTRSGDFDPGLVWYLAATLCGLDTLIFAGGIAENASLVRTRFCDGLSFLGIELDESRKCAECGRDSTDASRTKVSVIHTDEEYMIAAIVCCVPGFG